MVYRMAFTGYRKVFGLIFVIIFAVLYFTLDESESTRAAVAFRMILVGYITGVVVGLYVRKNGETKVMSVIMLGMAALAGSIASVCAVSGFVPSLDALGQLAVAGAGFGWCGFDWGNAYDVWK